MPMQAGASGEKTRKKRAGSVQSGRGSVRVRAEPAWSACAAKRHTARSVAGEEGRGGRVRVERGRASRRWRCRGRRVAAGAFAGASARSRGADQEVDGKEG